MPEHAAFCTVCGSHVEDSALLPADPMTIPRNTRPMKWHKFLIYFQLFLSTLISLYNAVICFRPKMCILFLAINCIVQALNLLITFGCELNTVSSAIGSVLTCVLMLVLSSIYYQKRADLFVN